MSEAVIRINTVKSTRERSKLLVRTRLIRPQRTTETGWDSSAKREWERERETMRNEVHIIRLDVIKMSILCILFPWLAAKLVLCGFEPQSPSRRPNSRRRLPYTMRIMKWAMIMCVGFWICYLLMGIKQFYIYKFSRSLFRNVHLPKRTFNIKPRHAKTGLDVWPSTTFWTKLI